MISLLNAKIIPTHHVPSPKPNLTFLPGRKSDSLTEPVFYHSGPYSLDEELVAGHAVGAINDLTPGFLGYEIIKQSL